MSTKQPVNFDDLHEGMALYSFEREVIQNNINLYAKASKDFNPIHIDEDFARNTPLGGTIAHGMLILAYISQMLTANFGNRWLEGGKLNVKFKTPARPGDRLSVSGTVRKIMDTETGRKLRCDILCRNQKSELIISGDAEIQ